MRKAFAAFKDFCARQNAKKPLGFDDLPAWLQEPIALLGMLVFLPAVLIYLVFCFIMFALFVGAFLEIAYLAFQFAIQFLR